MVKMTVAIKINISAYSSTSVMNNGEGTASATRTILPEIEYEDRLKFLEIPKLCELWCYDESL
mgnify:CR=1 FL=1